jgi:hypothetical protein
VFDEQVETNLSVSVVKRNQQTDDAMELVDERDIVEEIDDEKMDSEKGNRFTHINEDKQSSDDRKVQSQF